MRRYEAVHGALLEDPVCGRPAGHNGPCRSVQALDRERPGRLTRQQRRRRRVHAWLSAVIEAAERSRAA